MSWSLKIGDIKKGDVFYECEAGRNIQMTALGNARKVTSHGSKGYALKARLEDGELITLFEAFNAGAYGLRLYKMAMYGSPQRG